MLWLIRTPLLRGLYIAHAAASLLRNCGDEIGPVRGTEETGWYDADLLPRDTGLLADGTRACAGDVVKNASESTQTSPAGPEGDIGDGQLRIAQQGGRAFDAPREQITMRRNAKGLFERTREVSRGHATHAGQPLHRP